MAQQLTPCESRELLRCRDKHGRVLDRCARTCVAAVRAQPALIDAKRLIRNVSWAWSANEALFTPLAAEV
jgi:hypothetical protein